MEITGNDRTMGWVIERELAISAGSFDSLMLMEEIELATYRIRNLNLFHKVEISLVPQGDAYILQVWVLEKWYIWPIPFLEFSDRNFNIWQDFSFNPDRTNYGIYLFNYNRFRRNHTIKLSFIEGYHRRVGLEYRVPWFDKNSNYGLELMTYYDNQGEVWHRTEYDKLVFFKNGKKNLIGQRYADLKLVRRHSKSLWLGLQLGYNRTVIDSLVLTQYSPVEFLMNNSVRQERIFAGFEYEKDGRDNKYLAMKGYYSYAFLGYSHYLGTAEGYGKLELKQQRFMQMTDKLYSAVSVFGRYHTRDDLPYQERRMLGYEETVRGFENYVIDGKAAFHTSASLRYHLIHATNGVPLPARFSLDFIPVNVYIATFIDGGYVATNRLIPENKLPNQVLSSAGFSLQTLFYNDKVLRFDLSLNNLGESGVYIHFKQAI